MTKAMNTKHIIRNNGYNPIQLHNITTTTNTKTHSQHESQTTQKTKWVTFTYVGPQTKYITKLFKNTNLKIGYKTNNTIQKPLTQTNTSASDKFDNCRIYQLTCLDCNKQYVGQTGRSFRTRYREHLRDFKYNSGNSKYEQHLIEKGIPSAL